MAKYYIIALGCPDGQDHFRVADSEEEVMAFTEGMTSCCCGIERLVVVKGEIYVEDDATDEPVFVPIEHEDEPEDNEGD